MVDLPNTSSDQPFVIRASSASIRLIVPAWPVPKPIVVPVACPRIVKISAPVRAAFTARLAFVSKVILFAPAFCAPLTVITPVLLRKLVLYCQLYAPIFTAPVPAALPKIRFDQPDSKFPKSVSESCKVPACPVPIPIVVVAAKPKILKLPVPEMPALKVGFALVLMIKLFAPTFVAPFILMTPVFDRISIVSSQLYAPILTAAVPPPEWPRIILLQPSVICASSGSVKLNVPA